MDAGVMHVHGQHRPGNTGTGTMQYQHQQQPCGASFGFDGKLVQYFNVKGAKIGIGDLPHQRLVTISKVVTLPDLVARSERFDYALESGKIEDFCQEKAQDVEDSSEAKVWQFLQASFSTNPTEGYLTMLGYDSNEIFSKLDGMVGKRKSESSDTMTDGFVTFGRGVPDGYGSRTSENGEIESDRERHRSAGQGHDAEKHFEIATDDSTEGLINLALLSGNTEIAVNLCLQEGRWADALILASTGSQELIKKTQQKYFQKRGNETSNMIVAVVTRDLRHLVEHCNLHCWKEALATALTYSDPLGFPYLAETLGRRLGSSENEKLKKCALLCYICCGHINHLVESWALEAGKSESEKPEHLQDVVEQLMILKKAGEIHGKEFPQLDQILSDKLVKYGALLVSQGSLKIALKYISDSTDPAIVDLKQRVDVVLGTKPAVRQARSRQTSESSRHYPLSKRPSYPTPAVQQMSPVLTNTYDARRMSGYTDGPNISSLTGPPVPPAQMDPMGGFQSPLNVNTSYSPSSYGQQQHTPGASDPYYPQHQQDRRHSGTLPAPPVISSAPHGWNDPPPLKAKPKAAQPTQSVEAITHPIFGSAAPVPLNPSTPYGGGDGNSLLGYAPMGPPPPTGRTGFSQGTSPYGSSGAPTYGPPPQQSYNSPPSGQPYGMPPPSGQPYGMPPPSGQPYGMPPPPMASTVGPPPQSGRPGPGGSNYGYPPASSFHQPPPQMSPYGGGTVAQPQQTTFGSNPPYGMPQPQPPSNFGPPPSKTTSFGPPPTNASYGVPPTGQGSFVPSMASNVSTFAPPPTQNWNSAPPTSFPSNAPPTSFPTSASRTSFSPSRTSFSPGANLNSFPSSALPPTSFPSSGPPPTSFPSSGPPPTSFPSSGPPPASFPSSGPPPTSFPSSGPPPTSFPSSCPPPTSFPSSDPPPASFPSSGPPPTSFPSSGPPPASFPPSGPPPSFPTSARPSNPFTTNAPPTSFASNTPPTSFSNAPPSFSSNAPPSFSSNALPPTSFASNVPPPTSSSNAPPPTSFSSNAPPTSFSSIAPPPTSFPSTVPPTSFASNATPTSFSNAPPSTFFPSYQNPMAQTPSSYGPPPTSNFTPQPFTFAPDLHPYEEPFSAVGESQKSSKVENNPTRSASVPRPESSVGSALMESSPNPSPLPSPYPPVSTLSGVSLEDQFASVSLNAPPSSISPAEEAFPSEKEVELSNPTAPPITSFGPPFAPPSDGTLSQTPSFSLYQSQPPPQSINSNPLFNQGYSDRDSGSPIYHQNQPAPPKSAGVPPPSTARKSLPVETKGPIPEEHGNLPKVLEELRNACHVAAAQPQMKRKLDDVARKLEIFSEKLREGSLSGKTLSSLHRMVEAVENKDYSLALSLHTQLVTSGNFSEISSFLPAIKVLIQSATQLDVYL